MTSSSGAPSSGGGGGSWGSFLKSIASFNGDLSSLTAPAFILSNFSLTEFSAYWAEHPAIFVAPAKEPDPEKRALLVLKWFLSTLKQQYCSRNEKLGSEKKPLNPFLGELFLGSWKHEDEEVGEMTLVSEQVSHHPPVTAYCISNAKNGIQLQGYNAQKASFSHTINVRQVGHALLTLTPPNAPDQPETYLITLPALHIESLITGSPYVELEKYTHIASSTGYVCKIDYAGKGWLSGKKNTFTASMWKDGQGSSGGDEKHPLYTVEGQWSNTFRFSVHEGSNPKKGKQIDSYQATATTPLTVLPVEEMDAFESRRAWRHVAAAINKGDMDATSYYKSRIEKAQRELRKAEKAEGRDWRRCFFKQVSSSSYSSSASSTTASYNPSTTVITNATTTSSSEIFDEDDPHFSKLVRMISGATRNSPWAGVEPEKTNGIWRFDAQRAKMAKRPFHPDVGPAVGLGEVEGTRPEDAR